MCSIFFLDILYHATLSRFITSFGIWLIGFYDSIKYWVGTSITSEEKTNLIPESGWNEKTMNLQLMFDVTTDSLNVPLLDAWARYAFVSDIYEAPCNLGGKSGLGNPHTGKYMMLEDVRTPPTWIEIQDTCPFIGPQQTSDMALYAGYTYEENFCVFGRPLSNAAGIATLVIICFVVLGLLLLLSYCVCGRRCNKRVESQAEEDGEQGSCLVVYLINRRTYTLTQKQPIRGCDYTVLQK